MLFPPLPKKQWCLRVSHSNAKEALLKSCFIWLEYVQKARSIILSWSIAILLVYFKAFLTVVIQTEFVILTKFLCFLIDLPRICIMVLHICKMGNSCRCWFYTCMQCCTIDVIWIYDTTSTDVLASSYLESYICIPASSR